MDLADERRHAAAKSGDVEQLQVSWSYRAVRPMLDQATAPAFGAAVVGNGGRAHAPRRDGTPLARVNHSSMRFAVSFRSVALAHGTRTG